jgi:hypothetical protein
MFSSIIHINFSLVSVKDKLKIKTRKRYKLARKIYKNKEFKVYSIKYFLSYYLKNYNY